MRIGFIGARGVPHGYSSAEQIALHVGKRLVARGHEFTVYCRRNLYADRTPIFEGIRRVFIPTVEHKLFGQVIHGFLAGFHAATQPFDIVHAQCLTNAYQVLFPWLVRRNVVINVDGQEWDNPKWPRAARHLFFRSAVRLSLAICREIVTDARGMAEFYRQRYQRGSTVIAYGAEIVRPRRPEILESYGLEPRAYYFVAARLVPSNQIHAMVEAFNTTDSKRVLAIAGGGDYGSRYVQTLRATAGPAVKFLGLISDQQHMDELYANAYAYVHGATLGGINSALLRPMGAGCPAMAADTPFNREVVERRDGSMCGLLWSDRAQLAAALKRFDRDPHYVDALRPICVRQILENFTWDLVADQYEVYYRGFLEGWTAERIRSEVASRRDQYRTGD
ncbi:MAG: glycosyltransferase [bacterium]